MTPDLEAPFFENLEQLYRSSDSLRFGSDDRLVFFSDLHLGDGSSRDDFLPSSGIFMDVLRDYYLARRFTLFLNGDVEELHRQTMRKIRRRWGAVYELFDEFARRDDLYRTIGNHDHRIAAMPEEDRRYPFHHALKLLFGENEVFMFHGHQANMFYERHNDFTGVLLKYIANPLQIRNASVSHNSRKKFLIEKRAYEFSSAKKIVSIIGHTHRALFESLSMLESIKFQIELLVRAYTTALPEERYEIARSIEFFKKEIARLSRHKRREVARSTLYNPHLVVPCLFNSGAVIGKRGMTALEIGDDEIRLVQWYDRGAKRNRPNPDLYKAERHGRYGRVVLNREQLEYIFTRIRLLT